MVLALSLAASPAAAAVSVSRAELNGTDLRLEGTATASRDITVDGVVMGRSDSGGRFRIERSGYTAPSDCTVDVNDGSASPRTATLSGCTVTAPPPPPPSGPAAPALLAPADAASVTTPVTLSWSATIDPDPASMNGGYNWQISASATFGTLVAADSTLPSVTSDTVGGLVAGTYHWRVQAVDGDLRSSAWSAPTSFTVTGAGSEALAAPVLGTLVDGGQYHPMESFPFSWTAVDGAASYVVEASQDPAFPAPLGIRMDNVEGTRSGLTMHSSLIGDWYLRVRAVGADRVEGPASNVRAFSVSYDAPIGPPPVPLAPADGATVTLPFFLDWEDVSNPQSSGYVVEIARDPGFDDVEALSTGLTASRWEILGLSSGTKYWRVQHAEGDSSPTTAAFTAPSAPRSFTVAGGQALASVRLFDSPSAYSGTDRFGEVQLSALAPNGGAVVQLTSSNPTAVPVPATVTVPAGLSSQQFRVVYGQVTEPTAVTVTGTYAGSTATTSITVLPTALKRLGPGGSNVTGGAPAPAFVELNGAAPPGGAEVTLTSSSPLATPPATVTVPAGGFLHQFSIPTSPVSEPATVTITATWRGGEVTNSLVLNPGVPPATWTLERTTTTGSEGSNARVSIDAVQPTDTTFTLTSSNPDVAWMVPTVTIPAGSPHAGVLIQTRSPAASTTVTLSVSGAGVTRSAELTVNPIPLSPLPAPSLQAPAAGARFAVGQTVPFDWSDVAGAATYTLQVGTTSTFTTVVLTRTVTASQLATALTAKGDRYWRVRAERSDGSPGAWSTARSFRIK